MNRTWSRRDVLKLIGLGLAGSVAWWLRPVLPVTDRQRPSVLGTTFSQLQCRYLGLDMRETLRAVLSLEWDIIRVCAYWKEIEPSPGTFDFSTLDFLLNESLRARIPVILAVGMKSPRWPEFHFPLWVEARYPTTRTDRPLDAHPELAERALRYVDAVIHHIRDVEIVRYIQVENEPFNPVEVAGGRYLSPAFVRREVEQVRAIMRESQRIMLTNAINILPWGHDDEEALSQSMALADAVGINVYTRVPIGPSRYLEPLPPFWRKLHTWRKRLQAAGIEPWITEAQAEPWEWGYLVAPHLDNPPSASPERTGALVSRLARLGYPAVLLWGSEYWYWRKKHGDARWWNWIHHLRSPTGSQI